MFAAPTAWAEDIDSEPSNRGLVDALHRSYAVAPEGRYRARRRSWHSKANCSVGSRDTSNARQPMAGRKFSVPSPLLGRRSQCHDHEREWCML